MCTSYYIHKTYIIIIIIMIITEIAALTPLYTYIASSCIHN